MVWSWRAILSSSATRTSSGSSREGRPGRALEAGRRRRHRRCPPDPCIAHRRRTGRAPLSPRVRGVGRRSGRGHGFTDSPGSIVNDLRAESPTGRPPSGLLMGRRGTCGSSMRLRPPSEARRFFHCCRCWRAACSPVGGRVSVLIVVNAAAPLQYALLERLVRVETGDRARGAGRGFLAVVPPVPVLAMGYARR